MNQEMTSSSQSLTALQIVIISISVLVFMLAITYLIMSKFGSKTLVETFYLIIYSPRSHLFRL